MKLILSILLLGVQQCAVAQMTLSDSMISQRIHAGKRLLDQAGPSHMKQILGATHTSGKYHLTDKPFAIEGASKLDSLGFAVVKLWFYKTPEKSYPYHSVWNINKGSRLVNLAKHRYFEEAFSYPFSTIILSTSALGGKKLYRLTAAELKQEEDELYELSVYLLRKYSRRNVTFILQNWEGDWIFRGGPGATANWTGGMYPADLEERKTGMIAWFTARQKAVARARATVKKTKCKVYHAIEVNKVMESMAGVPGLTTDVLPRVKVDMISWSCYDGLNDDNGHNLYKGIDFIRQYMNTTGIVKDAVFIGEIGIPENTANKGNEEQILQRWKAYMSVILAQKMAYMVHWELYCNEPKDDNNKGYYPEKTAEELRGFWLLRPDGSAGFALKYFETLLHK